MIKIDLERRLVHSEQDGQEVAYPMDSPDAFAIVSEAWSQCGWDAKYAYTFSWFGRPVIRDPRRIWFASRRPSIA